MSRPIEELLNQLSPRDLKAARKKADKMLKKMALQELRQEKRINQLKLAEQLKTKQANISRLERRADMYISTLRNYIQALGGELCITAKFPDEEIQLTQFSQKK